MEYLRLLIISRCSPPLTNFKPHPNTTCPPTSSLTDVWLPKRLLPSVPLVEQVEREGNIVHHLENAILGYQLAYM